MHSTTRHYLFAAVGMACLFAGCSSDSSSAKPSNEASTTTTTREVPGPSTSAAPSTTVGVTGTVGADAAERTRSLFSGIGVDEPGCTIAVGWGDDIVFAEAYGAARLDPLEPMTRDSVVDIGSTSKQFTATAILLLAERGEVDLDQPLSTYLPELAPWANRPTLGQLMHHESGIPDYINLLAGQGVSLTGRSTDADALDALGGVTDLDFEPGAQWEYSNSNYFLLAEVVETVTGRDLRSFLAAEVFEPLGLDMVMDPTASIAAKATSYQRVGEQWIVADSKWEQLGDGGIQTTPTELIRWASQYARSTIGADDINEQRLIGAADTGFGTLYGAGIQELEVDGIGRVLSHSGAWGGFVTAFTVAPDRRIAAAATCTSPDIISELKLVGETDLLAMWAGG